MHAADRFLDVNGARLRCRDDGAGPAIVLVHGWTLDLDMWEPQTELAARFRVVRYDRRGFGLSTGEPSLAHDLADLVTVLDRLAIQRAMLVGMSQGARIALRFALAHPARVSCLVLDGPPDEVAPIQVPPSIEIPLDDYRQLAQRGQLAAVRSAWSRHPFTQLVTSDAPTRTRLDQILARYPGRDLLQPASAFAPTPPPLDSIATRTLILNGARDLESRRASGQRLCRAIPGARHTFVPEARHFPNLDNPHFYNAALCELLNSDPMP